MPNGVKLKITAYVQKVV